MNKVPDNEDENFENQSSVLA